MPVHYGLQIKAKVFQVREATGPTVRNGLDFYNMFSDIHHADREMFFVVTLNQKHKIIDKHLVSMGTLTCSLVHPREVYRTALLDNAAAVVFVHNHPSGDCTPSKEDNELTKRLCEAGKLLGIRVLDHVIVGDTYISFRDAGFIKD